MTDTIFKIIKTAKFQLTFLSLVIFYIVGLLLWEYHQDYYAEEIYPVLKVKEEVKRLASNVSTGLRINNFPNFSFEQNQFTMDAFVWFRFPIGTESLDTIEKFDFQHGRITYQSAPMIKLIENDVVVTYQVKVDFKAYLKFKDFPLGDHRLNIVLDNRTVTPNEMCFNCEISNFVLSKDILVTNWLPIKKIVQTGYIKSILNENDPAMETNYPAVVYTIEFENNSLRDLITLFFPMYVVFIICLLSLMIGINEHIARISLIATSMPILVLFRTVIIQLSPTTGGTTKADFVYFSLVFLSVCLKTFFSTITLSHNII